MAEQWYYSQQGQRQGPVLEEQLKQLAASGQLKPTDKVWKKGMAAWEAASAVEGLIPKPAEDEPPPLESSGAPDEQAFLNAKPAEDEPPPFEDAADTAREWYYVQGGQRKGPVSKAQLKQLASKGQLKPTDLIWKNGMSKWLPLNQAIPLAPPDPNAPADSECRQSHRRFGVGIRPGNEPLFAGLSHRFGRRCSRGISSLDGGEQFRIHHGTQCGRVGVGGGNPERMGIVVPSMRRRWDWSDLCRPIEDSERQSQDRNDRHWRRDCRSRNHRNYGCAISRRG